MIFNSNLLRVLIGLVLGIGIILLAIFLGNRIAGSRKAPPSVSEQTKTKIVVRKVENTDVSFEVKTTGSLQALETLELYSEVQGVMQGADAAKLFKPGQAYKRGEAILRIDAQEYEASIISQRAQLYDLLTQMMPDIQLDYSESAEKWQRYLEAFDLRKTLNVLPEFGSDKERYFVNSRGVVSTYYAIKNLEERLRKYVIVAPFDLVLTETNVYPGTLVRPGQLLGSAISRGRYELVAAVDMTYQDLLRVGQKVKLNSLDHEKQWIGRIARIDPAVDAETQGIRVYIETSAQDLRPGLFLEAEIASRKIPKSFEISRKLLVDNNQVFAVRGDTLRLIPVEVSFFKDQTAVIQDLNDGELILDRMIPGAYDGMLIEIIE